MNTEFHKKYSFQSQVMDSYDINAPQVSPIASLSKKMDKSLYHRISHEFKSFRGFNVRDPNVYFKIFALSVLEFIYQVSESIEIFDEALSEFFEPDLMIKCQEFHFPKFRKNDVIDTKIKFIDQLYKTPYVSSRQRYIKTIYDVLYQNEDMVTFLVLFGRGAALGFLLEPSAEKTSLLHHEGIKLDHLIAQVCNYREDFTLKNHFFLDILCKKFGRKILLIMPDTQKEYNFPRHFPLQTVFQETIIQTHTSIYWFSQNNHEEMRSSQSHLQLTFPEQGVLKPSTTTIPSLADSLLTLPSVPKTESGLSIRDKQYAVPQGPKVKSEIGLSNIKQPNGDDGTYIFIEDACKFCSNIVKKCSYINATYCRNCDEFICNDCGAPFSAKRTCRCNRCVVCFQEYCYFPMIIGKNCQNVCNLCYEPIDPNTFDILRYECGHGICTLCVFNAKIEKKMDPRDCYICNKKKSIYF